MLGHERGQPRMGLSYFAEAEQTKVAQTTGTNLGRLASAMRNWLPELLHELWRTNRAADIYEIAFQIGLDNLNPKIVLGDSIANDLARMLREGIASWEKCEDYLRVVLTVAYQAVLNFGFKRPLEEPERREVERLIFLIGRDVENSRATSSSRWN